MSILAAALFALFAGLTACGLIYTLAAAYLTPRMIRAGPPGEGPFPSISLLKPLHGAPPGLDAALESFCRQDYPGPVQIVFGVHRDDDPAVAAVERLRAARPDLDIALVVDGARHGTNAKVSNLINIARAATHELWVISDADIAVPKDYLRRLVDALAEPRAGAASCLYVGRVPSGGARAALWPTLAAMGIDYSFLPSVAVGRALGLAEPCFGSTIALSREVLARIGGFEAIADHLADDYEIGRRVRALGLRLVVPHMVVDHLCAETDLGDLVSHELRWARTIRQIDPGGHAGSLVTHVVPLSLITASLGLVALHAAPLRGWALWPCGAIIGSIGARVGLKLRIDAATTGRAGPLRLLLLRDLLSFGVFLGSFAINTVGWQGQRFRIDPDGVLHES